jgi:hypothetical protein
MSTRLPKDIMSQAMKQIGSKGGKAAAKNMTPEQRKARAEKASKAAAKKRTEQRLARDRASKRAKA